MYTILIIKFKFKNGKNLNDNLYYTRREILVAYTNVLTDLEQSKRDGSNSIAFILCILIYYSDIPKI